MAVEEDKTANFPSDFNSPEVKMSKEYALQWAQSTDKVGDSNIRNSVKGTPSMETLRAYARGNQSIEKYKPILGVRNKKTKEDPNNESYKVLNWEILDIATKYVNVLVGKMVKRDNTIGVKAIDKRAQDERRRKKIELQMEVINRPFYNYITKKTGIEFGGMGNDDVLPPPQSLGEVEVYQDMFYKEEYCMIVQDLLKEINEQDNYNEILMEVARDLTEVRIAATRTYRVGNKIRRRRCVPERMGISSSTKDNFEDAKWVYEDWDLTIGGLKEIAGDQFTEAEYRKIAETVTGSSFDDHGLQDYYDKNFCYPWDNTKITVRDLIWFSPDWETYQVGNNSFGNLGVMQKKYEWWEELRKKGVKNEEEFNLKNESKVIRYSLDNQYQCMWIKKTNFVFNYGKSKDMLKNESNLGRTISPYTIYRIKKSPVEVILPVLDNIQINWLQYQHHAAKSRPSGLDIEFTALQDISLGGAGGKRLTPKQVLQIYFDTGVLLWRRKDAMGNNTNFRPISELQNGINPAALQHFNMIINDINLLRDQVGLNELTDASTPNSEMGKAVATIAAGSVDDALRYSHHAFDSINIGTHERTVMFISGMAATGLAPHYSESVGLDKMGVLSLLSDLTHHELGVYLMRQPTEEMRATLAMYVAESVKAGSILGEEAIEITMEPNIYRAIKLLKMYRGQKEKKAQDSQEAMYKMEQEKNAASAQATAEANMMAEQAIWDLKTKYEWEKARAEAWKTKQTVADNAFLLQIENQLKSGQALTEIQQNRLTELMKINAQGEWDLRIQREKPKPTTVKK